MTQDPAAIAGKLSAAQKRAVKSAIFRKEDGAWNPEGYYTHGDKRVRFALATRNLTRDYLRRSNRLTPLGLSVRQILEEQARGE